MRGNKPSRKKVAFQVSDNLNEYLSIHNRQTDLPIQYDDMQRYIATVPLLDKNGNDTLWETLFYEDWEREEIGNALCLIYALLKTDGDINVINHLQVDRIDFCTFGNTHPYRIRIINILNDNYDHFYIKKVDASRIYGLELEELVSPNQIGYLVDGKTLVEEHIAGIPGDDFMNRHLSFEEFDEIRVAKEFIKFTERCFVRLLGDMRSYNYIVDITPDIEGSQYRIRAIDFDQQSYEGRKNFYLPQYFKENNSIIELGMKHLSPETVTQYQLEERSLIAKRGDQLSTEKKIQQLSSELSIHHKHAAFQQCKSMGEIVYTNIKLVLQKEFTQSILQL